MNRKFWETALNEVRDDQIARAANYKKRKKYPYFGAIAAILAVAITLSAIFSPELFGGSGPIVTAYGLVSAPTYPQMALYPADESDMDAYSAHWESTRELHNQPKGYAQGTETFFQKSMARFLSDSSGENKVYSPLNFYMALAMLAESTAGNTRQQILNLLGNKDIQSLRAQAEHMWKAHYWNDGLSTSILANSLWLDSAYTYNPQTVKLLSENYYASVFSGDLGSAEMTASLQSWLNEQTKGLLASQANNEGFDERTSLALASTYYYKVQWLDRFSEEENTEDLFFGAKDNTNTTYMNKTLPYTDYYWGDTFGAVSLNLEDGSQMWLVLPDQGVSLDAVLQEDSLYSLMRQSYEYENRKSVIVNLSVPKFDVAAGQDLAEGLRSLGITDVFEENVADFSPIISQKDGGYVTSISHAARVGIDEEGVTAAAYTVILRAGAGMPPEV